MTINMLNSVKCPDCDLDLKIPDDVIEGEIIKCSCCGIELEYHNGNVRQLVIEGEDWGE